MHVIKTTLYQIWPLGSDDKIFHSMVLKTNRYPKKNTNKKTLTKDNLPKNQTNHKNEPPKMERD